ncbi:hypothetical protein AMI01nite_60820 [Aneurinibacillus migulanus]|nr:hypothetical protein AMI01nite_60820 [Aneurinibacillus migulanus]
MTTQLTLFAEDTLVSLSVMPGSDKARQTTAISGRKCLDLCGNSGPLGLLEKMLLDTSAWASMMYLLTWKAKATKQGRLYFQLQPSKPLIEEIEYSLWATPNASDSVGSHGGGQGKSLRTDIHNLKKGIWPTPTNSMMTMGDVQQARYSGNDKRRPSYQEANKAWPTPTVNGNHNRKGISKTSGDGLSTAVKAWPTPAAQDGKNSTLPPSQIDRDTVPGALMREGQQGQLNPEWVERLMGFPIGWTDISGLQDMDKSNMDGSLLE